MSTPEEPRSWLEALPDDARQAVARELVAVMERMRAMSDAGSVSAMEMRAIDAADAAQFLAASEASVALMRHQRELLDAQIASVEQIVALVRQAQ